MSESQPISQQVFNGGVDASNAQFNGTYYCEKTNIQIFEDAKNEVREIINSVYNYDTDLRRELLGILNKIEEHFNGLGIDIEKYISNLLKQVSCDRKLTSALKYRILVCLINFYISASKHAPLASLPVPPCKAIKVDDIRCWSFTSAGSTALGLEHHYGAIADFLSYNKDINNGKCFIFNLLTKCSSCENGNINNDALNKIYLDFFRGTKINDSSELQSFFELEKKKNIIFKCGECLSNLARINESEVKI